MRKIDEDKLVELSTTNKMLDDKYGTLSFTAPYTLHNFAAKQARLWSFLISTA